MKIIEYFKNKTRMKIDLWTMIVTLILFKSVMPKPNIPQILEQPIVNSIPYINLWTIIFIICILYLANKYFTLEQYRYLCMDVMKEKIKIPKTILLYSLIPGIILISYLFYCDKFTMFTIFIVMLISLHFD